MSDCACLTCKATAANVNDNVKFCCCFCVGVNLVWGKKVKVANLLPAILFAVLWSFAPWA